MGARELNRLCSPRACRGVEYSFEGFFEREDSKSPGPLLLPTACPEDGEFSFAEVGPFMGVAVRLDGLLAG